MGLLVGKAVLVTGAGRGIGRAAALACAREGAAVLANDLGCDLAGDGTDPSVVEAVCDQIKACGGQAVSSTSSVTDQGTPDALVEQCRAGFGRIDAVFHAAGIAYDRVLSRLLDTEIDRILDVQLRAAIRLARAARLAMQSQQTGGAILLCSSQGAFIGQREHSAGCAADAGVVGFVRSAALELRRHGIRVNALTPLARTRMTEQSPMFQAARPDSLTPEHVAAVVTYLLSSLSSEVSGECVGAAGGRVYLHRLHETSGAFLEESSLDAHAIAAAWPQVAKA